MPRFGFLPLFLAWFLRSEDPRYLCLALVHLEPVGRECCFDLVEQGIFISKKKKHMQKGARFQVLLEKEIHSAGNNVASKQWRRKQRVVNVHGVQVVTWWKINVGVVQSTQ